MCILRLCYRIVKGDSSVRECGKDDKLDIFFQVVRQSWSLPPGGGEEWSVVMMINNRRQPISDPVSSQKLSVRWRRVASLSGHCSSISRELQQYTGRCGIQFPGKIIEFVVDVMDMYNDIEKECEIYSDGHGPTFPELSPRRNTTRV